LVDDELGPITMTLASRLRLARERAGISQRTACDRAGQYLPERDWFTQQKLARLETGVTSPDSVQNIVVVLAALARVYGVTYAWLAQDDVALMHDLRQTLRLLAAARGLGPSGRREPMCSRLSSPS
jgi:transcriptional regulator with XRE-family HTH domain